MPQIKTVGLIGLGIMGQAYAGNLVPHFKTLGFDPNPEACAAAQALGVTIAKDIAELANQCDALLLALASEPVLTAVGDTLAPVIRPGTLVLELGTFPVPAKEALQAKLPQADVLDCPVSGTGAQAKTADLVIFASGDKDAITLAQPIFDAIGRGTELVGAFGAGTRMKFVANLLVAIHNVAAAEALVMAEKSGLDPQMTLDVLTSSAATSRMLEIRGPMMVAESYTPATMKNEIFMKDMSLMLDFAREVETPVPLLAASLSAYLGAMGQGRAEEDTAAVHAVLKSQATPT